MKPFVFYTGGLPMADQKLTVKPPYQCIDLGKGVVMQHSFIERDPNVPCLNCWCRHDTIDAWGRCVSCGAGVDQS